jgi:hypothetical protein
MPALISPRSVSNFHHQARFHPDIGKSSPTLRIESSKELDGDRKFIQFAQSQVNFSLCLPRLWLVAYQSVRNDEYRRRENYSAGICLHREIFL